MESSNNTSEINTLKSIRHLLWISYKGLLISLAVYLCYKCLHFSPGFDPAELLLCVLIITCFIAIIKYHEIAKITTEHPKQFIKPSKFAMIGGILSLMMYAGLIVRSVFWVSDKFGEPLLQLLIIPALFFAYIIASNLVNNIFSQFDGWEH